MPPSGWPETRRRQPVDGPAPQSFDGPPFLRFVRHQGVVSRYRKSCRNRGFRRVIRVAPFFARAIPFPRGKVYTVFAPSNGAGRRRTGVIQRTLHRLGELTVCNSEGKYPRPRLCRSASLLATQTLRTRRHSSRARIVGTHCNDRGKGPALAATRQALLEQQRIRGVATVNASRAPQRHRWHVRPGRCCDGTRYDERPPVSDSRWAHIFPDSVPAPRQNHRRA
jgi:hypothetical protein